VYRGGRILERRDFEQLAQFDRVLVDPFEVVLVARRAIQLSTERRIAGDSPD